MKNVQPLQSVSVKLLRMNLIVAAIALLLASASFLIYDAFSFRQNLIDSLQTEARMLGSNSVSALLFNDADSARSTLSALHDSPSVLSAAIVSPDGIPLAFYKRDDGAPAVELKPLPAGRTAMHWFQGSQVVLGARIEFQGKTVGTVYILAETTEIGRRILRYLGIAGVVLLACLGAAMMLTASMRRVITGPVTDLASVAQTVALEDDYSLRAPPPADFDEIAVLVESFNAMLGQIQERDHALLASRTQLEQRVLERTSELEDANRELEAFSYSVAHDLRGPLDSIGNTAFVLKNADLTSLDPISRDLLDILPRSAHRMSALIDDLLNLSRSKSAVLRLEPVDLSAMAATIVRELQEANPDRTVEVSIAPRLMAIADAGLMRVVLSNLLGNAWKYTSRNPAAHIEFNCRTERQTAAFFICDNGAGFDPKFQHRLFQPFQRLHTQEEFTGTGIGLATVKRIISRHGGKIWALSVPDQGASFFFTIPG